MDYRPSSVILYSQDKTRMMDFLSDVFEFDRDFEADLITNGIFSFKLIEFLSAEKNISQPVSIKFTFKLKDREQIKEIIKKYNFFIYRKNTSNLKEEIFYSEEAPLEKNLAIKDIDGRVWQFEIDSFK